MLLLRAGRGSARVLSRTQVARRLRLPVAQVRRIERRGLRRLDALGRSGRCAVVAAAAAAGGGGGSMLALPAAFTAPGAAEPARSRNGGARSGVKGVSQHGARGHGDSVVPPLLGARATPLTFVLILAIALVALAFLVRRELPPRRH